MNEEKQKEKKKREGNGHFNLFNNERFCSMFFLIREAKIYI